MPQVSEAIRRIRQVYSVEGAEKAVAANERVAQSQFARCGLSR